MDEIWKPIKGFEDCYEISSEGRISSKERYVRVCGNGQRLVKRKIIKPTICKNGYLEAHLCKNGKRKVFLLHRLVAMHFIDNPMNYPEVNHKDENITNNNIDNLEWCTSKYNANYGTRNQRCMEKVIKKPVKQISIKGNLITIFPAIKEAARSTGIDESQIIRVCKGRNQTAGGFKWEYAKLEGI